VSTLDHLRTKYVNSPPWLRRWAGNVLQFVPPTLQFGGSFSRTLQEIERSKTSQGFVQDQRNKHLALLYSAAKTTPYFSSIIKQLSPISNNPSDLLQFPILNKEQVRKSGLDAFLALPVSELDLVSSSGSSGVPFNLYLNKNRSVLEWAFITSVWARIGYRPGHVRAVLRDVRSAAAGENASWSYDPALRELKLSTIQLSATNMDVYLELLDRYKVNFIHGYPSAIFILALHAQRRKWIPPKSLLGILPISEVLFDEQRELFSRVFGNIPVQGFYGLSEKVAFAGEIPLTESDQTGLYEFEPLYGITEIVDDDGSAVQVGETGRVIATGFLCKGQPMIRYDTGDRATLVREANLDNCYRLRAKNISSKWTQGYLVGRSGTRIPITALTTPKEEYRNINQMQYFQDEKGVVVLRIVPNDMTIVQSQFRRISEETAKSTANDLELRVELVNKIQTNSRGKRKFLVQTLTPSHSESLTTNDI
jgi:phenylacetate-CoA ligase